jgi:hypothetical protein
LSHASPAVHSRAQASSRTLRTGRHDDEEALLPLLCGGCSGQGMLLLSCEARGGGDVGAGHGQEGGGGWGGWWWVASCPTVRVRLEMSKNNNKIISSDYYIREGISSETDACIDRYEVGKIL